MYGSAQEAVAATATPTDSFASQKELAQLAATWPAERLVAIWNSLPGVEPVEGFKSAKAAANRIWERVQGPGAMPPSRKSPDSAHPLGVARRAIVLGGRFERLIPAG